MPWVERDGLGNTTGLFANRQPGFADEFLPDTHADVIAFRNPAPTPQELARNALRGQPDTTPITKKDLVDTGLI